MIDESKWRLGKDRETQIERKRDGECIMVGLGGN